MERHRKRFAVFPRPSGEFSSLYSREILLLQLQRIQRVESILASYWLDILILMQPVRAPNPVLMHSEWIYLLAVYMSSLSPTQIQKHIF